jgi:hypothetical protein
MVMQWLSPFDSEAEQNQQRKTRSVCKDPGRWLLNNSRLREWFDHEDFSTSSLWLSGIPGAGMALIQTNPLKMNYMLNATRQDNTRVYCH